MESNSEKRKIEMYFEFHQLPDHVQSLITDFVDLNAFSSGENREYYRGGYELIRYACLLYTSPSPRDS